MEIGRVTRRAKIYKQKKIKIVLTLTQPQKTKILGNLNKDYFKQIFQIRETPQYRDCPYKSI